MAAWTLAMAFPLSTSPSIGSYLQESLNEAVLVIVNTMTAGQSQPQHISSSSSLSLSATMPSSSTLVQQFMQALSMLFWDMVHGIHFEVVRALTEQVFAILLESQQFESAMHVLHMAEQFTKQVYTNHPAFSDRVVETPPEFSSGLQFSSPMSPNTSGRIQSSSSGTNTNHHPLTLSLSTC
eukprot:TRINITY_DN4482_c0_g1_i1.p1 TRINITY_DN4482_c0_g1~~TRINITY_DN4482_c0_g1_i1.p1  ORF type:complete len:192 (-),score=53.78 TRINITY_DN4482_c0_g1_i1:599-1141(-)